MLSFRKYITESIRQGLPHVHAMDHGQLSSLLSKPHIDLNSVTEKTDGTSFLFGHDQHGFYTQSTGSGSERMRSPEDYHTRGRARAQQKGTEYDPFINTRFGEVHSALSSNPTLQHSLRKQYQASGDAVVRGELFHHGIARDSDVPGEKVFVGTSYDPAKLNMSGRKVGSVVIHTKLPENHWIDPSKHSHLWSDHNIGFADDTIKTAIPPLSTEPYRKRLEGVDSEMVNKRAAGKIKDQVMSERAKVSDIASDLSKDIDKHISTHGAQSKFGSGSEGLVVHGNPVRFKVTSPQFRQFKQATKDQDISALRGRND